MKPDLFEAPDYYCLDDLLTDEHKLIRDSARDWVKKSISPIIEEYAQKAEFPNHIIKELADIGAFGPIFQKNTVDLDLIIFLMDYLCKK